MLSLSKHKRKGRPSTGSGRADQGSLPNLLSEIYRRLFSEYGPQHWWPSDGPFETIAGAILTQNTAWTNVEKALRNLREANALSARRMRELTEAELAELIRPSGYFNGKAKKLKAMAVYLAGFDDDLSSLRSRDLAELRTELLGVHGVGPETADDILLYAVGLPSFVMDAYTRRIVDRIGVTPQRDSYEGYRALFQDHLPHDVALFNEYHALLDHHAKVTCTKRAPHCDGCCLRDLCAARSSTSEIPGRERGAP